jgi:hypothetical protein
MEYLFYPSNEEIINQNHYYFDDDDFLWSAVSANVTKINKKSSASICVWENCTCIFFAYIIIICTRQSVTVYSTVYT